MEKRDGGVDEERVRGGEKADDPVGGLEEEASGDDGEQLGALVEQNFEADGDEPQNQSGHEERPYLVLILACRSTHCATPLSLSLSL